MRARCAVLLRVLRSVGKQRFLPGVIALLVVPAINLVYWFAEVDTQFSLPAITRNMQFLLPILSVWWIYFAIRERLEGVGREVLWAYQPSKAALVADLLLTWLWSAGHITLSVVIQTLWFSLPGPLLPQLLAQSLFFVGIFLLFATVSRSAGAGFLLILSYYVLTVFLSQGSILTNISVFLFDQMIGLDLLLGRYSIVAIIGVAAAFAGVLVMRQRNAR